MVDETLVVKLGVGDTLAAGTGVVPGAPAGVRRSTRERKQVKHNEPSMTGQKFVFAAMAFSTTKLDQLYLYNDSYQHNATAVYAIIQQLSLNKSTLK